MMGAICIDDSSDADDDWDRIDHNYADLGTPSSTTSETPTQSQQYDNQSDGSEEEYGGSTRIAPRKGGYDSRIEQYLYENPQHPILIVEGGKSLEGGGKYIVYTIRTGVSWEGPRNWHTVLT